MARDDWRIRIDLEEEQHAGDLLARLGLDLGSEARELARELEARRLAVSRDGDVVFVYASSGIEADQARAVVEAELRDEGITPRSLTLEHWLADEDRWSEAVEPPVPGTAPGEALRPRGEIPQATAREWEEEVLARGYAPWEVRLECDSVGEAHELADRLEAEGYGVVRGFRYVIAGTATRDEARALARRLHGEIEPGGELVWEVTPQNPFAVFGGLGA
jgi:hypothetical protein